MHTAFLVVCVCSEAKCRCHPHWCVCMINLLNHRNSPHVILQVGKWSVDQRLGCYNKVFSDNKISVSSQLSTSTIPYTFEWEKIKLQCHIYSTSNSYSSIFLLHIFQSSQISIDCMIKIPLETASLFYLHVS